LSQSRNGILRPVSALGDEFEPSRNPAGDEMDFRDRGYRWPELVAGRLLKRYKRFLADVILDDGKTVTAHCPNSGRMTECSLPGQPVFLSRQDNPKRKLKYRWELIEMPTSLVGVNTLVPNRLVADALRAGRIPALETYGQVAREVSIHSRSRLDLKLEGQGLPDCYVEIKNCTLVTNGVAMFPDAPTTRGQKHLRELALLKRRGFRAVIFFLVQRMDACTFVPADPVDPEYGRQLRQAVEQGVEIMVYDTEIDLKRIRLRRPLPWSLG
jgi:sugar fermentation stimulation protein A